MNRGRLIAFCGVDGSGKSYAAQLTCVSLNERGFPSEVIAPLKVDKAYLANVRAIKGQFGHAEKEEIEHFISEYISYHLFVAIHHDILPKLERGITVICDRYLISHFVNQAVFGVDVTNKFLWKRIPMPDIIFYMDTPIEVCLDRLKQRSSKGVGDHEAFLTQSKQKFEEYAAAFSFVRMNGMLPADKLKRVILEKLGVTGE